MKHFTPERYLRLGNLDEEREFLDAQEEWEGALAAYSAQLQRIRKELPRTLRQLIESVYLHDARVLSMHQREDVLVATLQPESDPHRLVVLGYSLVEEPLVKQHQLPEERCRTPIQWLYDEVDLDRPEGPRGLPAPADRPTFRHDILLSNGWEVALRFRAVWVHRPIRVIPVVPGHAAEKLAARLA